MSNGVQGPEGIREPEDTLEDAIKQLPETRAVVLVNEIFYPDVDVDFEVVSINRIGPNWTVRLDTNLDDDRSYEVTYRAEFKKTFVNAYSLVDDYAVSDDDITQGPFNL